MRTFRMALLAATIVAGMPGMAFAQDQGREHDGGRGGERGGDRGGRPDGGQRGDGGARPEAQVQQAPQQQAAAPQARPDRRGGDDRRQFAPGDRGQRQEQARGPDGQRFEGRPDGQRFEGRPDGQRFDGNRSDGQRFDNRQGNAQRDDRRFDGQRGDNRAGYGRPDDRRFDGGRPGGNYGGNYGTDRRPGPDRAWRPGYNWRADRSYDWRGYRNSNRGAFSIGRYYAPRGWNQGYRRFGIGYRLPSFFYGQSYWLDDPYDYRLPPAYGQYRWIRYYNDVLLVDLRTGAIVDEIPDFFW